MRSAAIVFAGALLAVVAAQSADDIAFCAALTKCKQCALSNRCVWCKGAPNTPQGPGGSCIPGNLQGPTNATACQAGPSDPGLASPCGYVAEVARCASEVCYGGSTMIDCLSQGENCGYCTDYSPVPFTDPMYTSVYVNNGNNNGNNNGYYGMSSWKYPISYPAKRAAPYCTVASDDLSGPDIPLNTIYIKRERADVLNAPPFNGDINKYFDAYRCTGSWLTNKAPINTQQAVDAARSTAQTVCSAYTTPETCSMQDSLQCYWCKPNAESPGVCVGVYPDYSAREYTLYATDRVKCPGNLAISNNFTSDALAELPENRLKFFSPSYCPSLTAKGMRTCASNYGCRWCHTANSNAGACMFATDALDTKNCPALPTTIVSASQSFQATPYCGAGDVQSCDRLCQDIGTDLATCLKFSGPCALCLAPDVVSWEFYQWAFNNARSTGVAGSLRGVTYCAARNGTGAVDATTKTLYSSSGYGYSCGNFVASGFAPKTWLKGKVIPAPASPAEAVAVAQSVDPCNMYSTCSECLLMGATLNCGVCRDASGASKCMTGAGPSFASAPPGRCDAPSVWNSSSFNVAGNSIQNKLAMTDICGASTCADMNNLPGGCVLSQISRESCAFCKVNNKVVPIDKSTWRPYQSAAPSQADCAWGSDATQYLWTPWTGSSSTFGASVQQCEAATVPAQVKCGGVTDATSCLKLSYCGWCLTNGKCVPTIPFSNAPSPLTYIKDGNNAISYETCPGSLQDSSTTTGPFIAGGPSATLRPLTCTMASIYYGTSMSTTCPACLTMKDAVDGPCGWIRTTGQCAPGSANGIEYSRLYVRPGTTPDPWPAVYYDNPPYDRSYKRNWLFGAEAVASCPTVEDVCAKYNGDVAGCSTEAGGTCQFCVSDKTCRFIKSGSPTSCPKGAPDVLSLSSRPYRFDTVAGYCESLTKYNATICIAQYGCGAYLVDGTFKCLQANTTDGRPLDLSAAPNYAVTADPYSAPGSLTKIPSFLTSSLMNGYGQALGILPYSISQGSLTSNCTECLGYLKSGFGFCLKNNRCVGGNSTFGPFDKSQCEEGYFITGSSSKCKTPSISTISPSDPGYVAYSCRSGLASAMGSSKGSYGLGFCAGVSRPAFLPGSATGPVNSFCTNGWVTQPDSCDAAANASIGLSFVALSGVSWDSVPTSVLSPCDRACLSKGITVSRRIVGWSGSTAIFNSSISSVVRTTGIAGCQCQQATVREDSSYFTSSTIWASGSQLSLTATPLSSQPSPANTTLKITRSVHSSRLATFALYVQAPSSSNLLAAYYQVTGCTGTLASRYCSGSLYSSSAITAKTLEAGAHPCPAACLQAPLTTVVINANPALTVLIPNSPLPPAGLGAPASCRCQAVTLQLGGACTDTTTKLQSHAATVRFPYFNQSINIGNFSDSDITKGVLRLMNGDTKADGGYIQGSTTACFGVTGSYACPNFAGINSLYVAPDATPSAKPTYQPIAAILSLASLNTYTAALKRQTLAAAVDDCTYACMTGGYNVVVDVSTVKLAPAITMPYSECGCPVISGSSSGGKMSGRFTSGVVPNARRLQAAGAAAYDFSAEVTGQDEITVSLTLNGVAVGSAVYDTPGCANTQGYFCGRAPPPVDPPVAAEDSGLSAGQIAAIVVGSIAGVGLLAGGGYFAVKKFKNGAPGKSSGKGSSSSKGKATGSTSGSSSGLGPGADPGVEIANPMVLKRMSMGPTAMP